MRFDDFDFHLPEAAIARRPLPDRDRARLLVLDRATGDVSHHRVGDLPDLLRPGDRLVLNDSRVGAVTWPRYLAHLARAVGDDGPPPDFYNTVYARTDGSLAPPSAGLNLSRATLDRLASRGIGTSPVTHHVGAVTYRHADDHAPLTDHVMEAERFTIPASTAHEIATTKADGGRVVAVGTTTTRALEHAARHGGLDDLGVDRVGTADLFITPGHEFAVLDGLLTGLHAPRTTLFVLICAFAGRAPVLEAYREALAEGYRWYTLGDSMLIL